MKREDQIHLDANQIMSIEWLVILRADSLIFALDSIHDVLRLATHNSEEPN